MYLRAEVCDGLAVEIPVTTELRSLAQGDVKHANLVKEGHWLIVCHGLDDGLELTLRQGPTVASAFSRFDVHCVVTEKALVFSVVNKIMGTGAGFAIFPFKGILALCE